MNRFFVKSSLERSRYRRERETWVGSRGGARVSRYTSGVVALCDASNGVDDSRRCFSITRYTYLARTCLCPPVSSCAFFAINFYHRPGAFHGDKLRAPDARELLKRRRARGGTAIRNTGLEIGRSSEIVMLVRELTVV